MRPIPQRANIYAGLDHQVTVHRNKDGSPIRSTEKKRPAGMSGRQWKRTQREARKVQRAVDAVKEKQLAGFFSMRRPVE